MPKNRIKNTWIIFLSVVAVLATGLSIYSQVTAGQSQIYVQAGDKATQRLNDYYRQSLYQLTDSMKNINANLGKISVSSNTRQQQKLLILVEGAAESANRDLALLPIADNGVVEKSVKYTNQVSDYSKFLSEKLAGGTPLSNDDRNNLSYLEGVSDILSQSLNRMSMDSQTSFVNVKDSEGNGSISVNTEDIGENTFDYPQLVYDGPYSDAVTQKQIKQGKKISLEQGEKYIRKAFSDYNLTSVEYAATIENKTTVYAYDLVTNNGQTFQVALTPDGRVAQMDGQGMVKTPSSDNPVDMDAFQKEAETFARKLGFPVKAIWSSLPIEGRVYVNLCYVENDTIVYPDMVKVALDAETGKVVGFESYSYLANHIERQIDGDYSNVEGAIRKITKSVEVVGINKAIIPVGQKEYRCYEFVCEKGDDTYLIYIDADNLVERDIFKVVKGIEGYSVI